LTPTSYVVLGLLATQGPLTPYGMKQLVEGGLGHLWSFPHSQLYLEPERLHGLGLVTERREAAGRRRKEYRITAAGRAAFAAWLADAQPSLTEIRDPALLRLFFAGASGSAAEIAALAQAQVASHGAQLAHYQELDAALAAIETEGVDRCPRLTLQLGLAYERQALAFWTSVEQQHAPDAGTVAAQPGPELRTRRGLGTPGRDPRPRRCRVPARAAGCRGHARARRRATTGRGRRSVPRCRCRPSW